MRTHPKMNRIGIESTSSVLCLTRGKGGGMLFNIDKNTLTFIYNIISYIIIDIHINKYICIDLIMQMHVYISIHT